MSILPHDGQNRGVMWQTSRVNHTKTVVPGNSPNSRTYLNAVLVCGTACRTCALMRDSNGSQNA